ncbi:MFS transporter [Ferviditalea candida]|uniref:MFS transporter n=1 Tax=Ferviditalea candida TaxID=3108399 RepID=A0ABU5ZGP6_9BACL|nr:MFS transporter [Paenibacillaceae bacterium T2]
MSPVKPMQGMLPEPMAKSEKIAFSRWLALFWIAVSVLFSLSLWFSASVVLEEIEKAWNAGKGYGPWITAAVQLGFISGSLISSLTALPDRMNPRRLFALSSLLGAAFNGWILVAHHAEAGLLLRFLTGVSLAGVYPVGVKLLSQWFPRKRGLGIGVLIAALTLGSALPHFVAAYALAFNWKWIIAASSILAVAAAAFMQWVLPDVPKAAGKQARLSFGKLREILANRPIMLANYGYFGHMWELYAVWTWLPMFLKASFASLPNTAFHQSAGEWYSFLIIGVAGAFGCIAGGLLADKIGRARLSGGAMAVSALCSITIGFTYGQAVWITLLIALVWGIAVIADSAQFSAAVTEYSNPEYVGTALTFQMAVGFFISVFSINLIPFLQSWIGWQWVFAVLAIGPALGVISMGYLRKVEVGTPSRQGQALSS